MSERDDSSSSHESHSQTLSSPLKTLLHSLNIFLRNKQIFLSIFAFITIPLSLLLFSLFLSSHPLKSHIYHLESVARLAPTRFEFRHVFKESRSDAVVLLHLKAFFFIPSYILSLIAAITAVNSTALAFNGKRPTLKTAVAAVKSTWLRTFVTNICAYAILAAYVVILRSLAALTGSAALRFAVLIMGSGLEVYLIAVMSLGIVISVVEEESGWEAIRVGWRAIAGRRYCGWILTGMFLLGSRSIAWGLKGLMDGEDHWMEGRWTVVMRVVMGIGDKAGLICLYGMVILWGFVVNTVFYCECSRWHVNCDS